MTLAQAVTKLEREHLTARAEAAEKAVKRTAILKLQDERDTLMHDVKCELHAFALANLNGKKSIELPHGVLKFRTIPGGPKVVDTDAAIDWADLNNQDLIKLYVSIADQQKAVEFAQANETEWLTLMASLKTADYQKLAATTHDLPGIEIVPPSEAFYINSERVEIPDEAQKEGDQKC